MEEFCTDDTDGQPRVRFRKMMCMQLIEQGSIGKSEYANGIEDVQFKYELREEVTMGIVHHARQLSESRYSANAQ